MVYTAYKPQVLGGKTTPQGAAFSQLMRELLYLSTPKDFTLFNSMRTFGELIKKISLCYRSWEIKPWFSKSVVSGTFLIH